MSIKLAVSEQDYLAEPHIYHDMCRRGVHVTIDGGVELVPSAPLPCSDCETGTDHGECRVVRGLITEVERLTDERDQARTARDEAIKVLKLLMSRSHIKD